MQQTAHLIDSLGQARIEAPAANFVEAQTFVLNRESRLTLFQHPDSDIVFCLTLPETATILTFGIGIKQSCWERIVSAVSFAIDLRDDAGRVHRLFRKTLDPSQNTDDRRWDDHELDIGGYRGRSVELLFQTRVDAGRAASYAWAGWSDPVVRSIRPLPSKALKVRRHRDILLITSDALGSRFLGCYGNREVRTPGIDSLADDGTLFLHARSQSSATLASYASLLTGLNPLRHGVLSEWGSMPAGVPNLPAALHSAGYHTLLAASEIELSDPAFGLPALFCEHLPTLAQPAQDGATTTRRYLDWLSRRPDMPCFTWLQFFDTHPPALPPARYSRMYYQGDPSSPERRNRPDSLAAIHGVETIACLEAALPLLAQGLPDIELTRRLRATAQGLRGEGGAWPDIASHIRNLGSPVMMGMSVLSFADWLDHKGLQMERGDVPGDFTAWIKSLRQQLQPVEDDILSWLDGVVDADFPFSQYLGSVSFMDSQVGILLEELKHRGDYDNTTIIFTSPHGESFGSQGISFHHHALLECCLKVPLIIKPAGSTAAGRLSSQGIRGVFDLVDLFPTLLDAAGLPPLRGLDGLSRSENLRHGTTIPDHPSFSVDMSDVMRSVLLKESKLVRAAGHHRLSRLWDWRAGEERLFLTGDDNEEAADTSAHAIASARELRRLLDEFGMVQ